MNLLSQTFFKNLISQTLIVELWICFTAFHKIVSSYTNGCTRRTTSSMGYNTMGVLGYKVWVIVDLPICLFY